MTQIKPARTLREWRTVVFAETQEEFARRLGVNVTALGHWETGRRHPRMSTRRAIALALSVPPEQIIFDIEGKLAAAA